MDRWRGITRQTHLLPAVWLRLLETDTKTPLVKDGLLTGRERNTEVHSSRLAQYPGYFQKKKKKRKIP